MWEMFFCNLAFQREPCSSILTPQRIMMSNWVQKLSAQSTAEVRKKEAQVSAGVCIPFDFFPLKILRSFCPSRERVSNPTKLFLGRTLGFQSGVIQKEQVVVHNASHLHASPTHPTPRHPSKGFCCYLQPQQMHTEPLAKSRSWFSADPSVCIHPCWLSSDRLVLTLQLISAQSTSAHALLLPDQCPQKIPTTLAMAGRGRQKKSRDGKECTILYRWFTPDIDSTPKGADAISVSVVLCVFSKRHLELWLLIVLVALFWHRDWNEHLRAKSVLLRHLTTFLVAKST